MWFNCRSTNAPAQILHVKLKFKIGHSTCGTLLNKKTQALMLNNSSQSFKNCILAIFLPTVMQQNDVVVSFV